MTSKQLVIFIGPPGAGKGSISQLCVQDFGWKQLSTGHLCRKHINEQTEIGKEIDFSIKSGKLVSDRLIVNMVEQWLTDPSQHDNPIILDGFPRNIARAEALYEIIEQKLSFFRIAIFKFHLTDEVVLGRLLGRLICENKDCQIVYSSNNAGLSAKQAGICDKCSSKLIRRSDDEAETIKHRLGTYRTHEKGLLDFYEDKGVQIEKVNVEKPLKTVFQEFTQLVTGSKS